MKNIINELWHGNIIPGEDSRNNSKEMKAHYGGAIRHKRITKVCYKSYALVPKWSEAIFIQS